MKPANHLPEIADTVKNFAVIYLCDIDDVKDFNEMYELYDACTVMVRKFRRYVHVQQLTVTSSSSATNSSCATLAPVITTR